MFKRHREIFFPTSSVTYICHTLFLHTRVIAHELEKEIVRGERACERNRGITLYICIFLYYVWSFIIWTKNYFTFNFKIRTSCERLKAIPKWIYMTIYVAINLFATGVKRRRFATLASLLQKRWIPCVERYSLCLSRATDYSRWTEAWFFGTTDWLEKIYRFNNVVTAVVTVALHDALVTAQIMVFRVCPCNWTFC